jgi:hypothetical protein
MRLPKVKFAPTGVPTISEMVGMAAQAVGDGLCHPVSSSTRQAISKAAIAAAARTPTTTPRGARQWTAPRGNHGGNDFINIFPHNQYCLKYGGKHDDLAPFVTMGVQCHPQRTAAHHRGLRQFALHPEPAQALGLRPTGQCIGRVSLHDGRARPRHAAAAGLCAQSLTAQLQEAHHAARFGRDRGLDRPRRQENVRGCRAWAHGR